MMKLDKECFSISQSEDHNIGFSLFVTIKKEVFKEDAQKEIIDPKIAEYEFEFLLSNSYPYRPPQLLCHTDFGDRKIILTDNRDLYAEVIGEGGDKLPHTLASVTLLIPDFIIEMYTINTNEHFIGTFHVGTFHNLNNFNNSHDTEALFLAQEQNELEPTRYLTRYVCVT